MANDAFYIMFNSKTTIRAQRYLLFLGVLIKKLPKSLLLLSFTTCLFLVPSDGYAADPPPDLLAEPDIIKIEPEDRDAFRQRFRQVSWTGAGFTGSTVIDRIPTRELRARLQKVYGDPTQKLKDLFEREQFRPGHYIQFEYWFVINDQIPMMILDIDGPFGNGLVFAGDNRYVDLMPEIKRTLSRKLMYIKNLAPYKDHYYDLNSRQWYLVIYEDGEFANIPIARPNILK